jgi:hypothetical protein
MLASIQFRIFCLPVSYLKTQSLKYTELYFPVALYESKIGPLALKEPEGIRRQEAGKKICNEALRNAGYMAGNAELQETQAGR